MISKTHLSAILVMLLVLTQSCTSIRLISDYDEITDRTVTELQEKVSNYFVKLERTIGTDDAKYENYVQQFDEIKVNLNTLEVRAAAFDKNRIVQEHVKELKNMVNNLEALHKIGFSSYDQSKPLIQPFNSAFTAIIKLQLALKRGEKTDGNN
jgi:hypothetical protein